MKTKTINEIYHYSKVNNKCLLINQNEHTYPTIEGNTSNFLTDYKNNYKKLDRMFNRFYGERTYFMPLEDSASIGDFYEDFHEMVNSILSMHLLDFARIYYALSKDYEPLWNKEGKETTQHSGFISKETGTTTNTDTMAERNAEDTTKTGGLGSNDSIVKGVSDTINSSVPYDMHDFKDTDKTKTETTPTITKSNSKQEEYEDEHTTTHGKNVETTEKIETTYGGNIGVTKTSELITDQFILYTQNNFWRDVVFKTIAEEVGAYYN